MGVELQTVVHNSHIIDITPEDEAFDYWFLLRSDAHHDNAHTLRDLESQDLDECVAKDGYIIDGGDLFCAMQGKWDKRADYNECRPEHRNAQTYLSDLVKTAADYYEPYWDRFLLLGPGNHETSVSKKHGVDLTGNLIATLNERTNNDVQLASYAGWLTFRIRDPKAGTVRRSIYVYRHHGYGGGGPVTRGVIQTNRMQVYLPDANIVWTGHTHDEWIVPIPVTRLSIRSIPYSERRWHIKTPGYKEEFLPGDGWHIERGGPPKSQGAAWLHITGPIKRPKFRLKLTQEFS